MVLALDQVFPMHLAKLRPVMAMAHEGLARRALTGGLRPADLGACGWATAAAAATGCWPCSCCPLGRGRGSITPRGPSRAARRPFARAKVFSCSVEPGSSAATASVSPHEPNRSVWRHGLQPSLQRVPLRTRAVSARPRWPSGFAQRARCPKDSASHLTAYQLVGM